MANLNAQSASLSHPSVTGRQFFTVNRDETITFHSPAIRALASAELRGAAGENVTGWKLGFFQLQFIETNYSRYRGQTERDGSAKVSWSPLRLCRDTDETSRALRYDPQNFSASTGRGIARPSALPASGNLLMQTGFGDAPQQPFNIKVRNNHSDNFLHHADIAFHFCTMLVAEDPHHHFTFLKYFYWNVRWEAHFHPDAAGKPQLTRIDHFDLNVQRQIHSGIPDDARFKNQVLSRSLPISNIMARLAPRAATRRSDWSLS